MLQLLVPAAWLWVVGSLVGWLSAGGKGGLLAVGCLGVAFAFLEAGCHSGIES